MKSIAARIVSSRNASLAGSLASLLLHGLAILLVCLVLGGFQRGGSGETGGDPSGPITLFIVEGVEGGFAEVGIAAGTGDADITLQSNATSNEETPLAMPESSSPLDRIPNDTRAVNTLATNSECQGSIVDVSSTTTLPPMVESAVPLGRARNSASIGAARSAKSSEAGGTALSRGHGGLGSTTFMDVEGVGKSFVYVIDNSSSMQGHRLKIARSQLKASLRLLQPSQRFAVIFYNEYHQRLQLRRQPKLDMYFATASNLDVAAHEVDRISCGSGTLHLPAVLEALSLKPVVLYLLTDGEPELYAADLAKIRRVTDGTTIHAIRFSEGNMSSVDTSWMERLAHESGGNFRESTPE